MGQKNFIEGCTIFRKSAGYFALLWWLNSVSLRIYSTIFTEQGPLDSQLDNIRSSHHWSIFLVDLKMVRNHYLYRCLRRVNVSYQSELSLHFDLPSLFSCRTQSPLLRASIRIPACGLSRHSQVDRPTVHSPFKLLRHQSRSGSHYRWWSSSLVRACKLLSEPLLRYLNGL